MKKMNCPLLIGSIILFTLLLIVLFPERFTRLSPYTIQQLRFYVENGALNAEKAPFKPSAQFILGTDDLGRDIWSYIVYGTRLTLFLGIIISCLQFLIALPMGLFGGMGNKAVKTITEQINVVFSAIPALLLCVLILQIDFFVSLDKKQSMIAFIVVIALVGWAKLGTLLLERIEMIYKQPFIQGEIALGKSMFRIGIENIIPHLVPECIVLFFMEVARNLSMMMQLGIFGVFIGNLKVIMDSDRGAMTFYNISYEPEWASMLSTSRTYLTVAPWSVIFPALAFFITVLGFNLVGEGFRKQLQHKDSLLIPSIRKVLQLDRIWLRQAFKAYWNMRRHRIALGIVVLFVLMTVLNQPRYSFSTEAWEIPSGLPVIMGNENADETADYIVSVMETLGVEPIEENGFLYDYPTEQANLIMDQNLFVMDEFNRPIGDAPRANVDFSFLVAGDFSIEGNIYDASGLDLLSMDDFSIYEHQFVLIREKFYDQSFLRYYIEQVQKTTSVLGFILVNEGNTIDKAVMTTESTGVPVIEVSRTLADRLLQHADQKIHIKSSVIPLNPTGKNIVGIYKGTDKALEEEIIAVGFNYNYIDAQGADVLSFNLELMKQLCEIKGNKRSILFIFTDGTLSDTFNGIQDFAVNFPISPQKVKVFLDLTGLTSQQFNTLQFSHRQAQITRQFAWSIGQMLEDEFQRKKIKTQELKSVKQGNEYVYTENTSDNAMYWDAGIATIIIKSEPTITDVKVDSSDTVETSALVETVSTGKIFDLSDLGSVIVKVIAKNNY